MDTKNLLTIISLKWRRANLTGYLKDWENLTEFLNGILMGMILSGIPDKDVFDEIYLLYYIADRRKKEVIL